MKIVILYCFISFFFFQSCDLKNPDSTNKNNSNVVLSKNSAKDVKSTNLRKSDPFGLHDSADFSYKNLSKDTQFFNYYIWNNHDQQGVGVLKNGFAMTLKFHTHQQYFRMMSCFTEYNIDASSKFSPKYLNFWKIQVENIFNTLHFNSKVSEAFDKAIVEKQYTFNESAPEKFGISFSYDDLSSFDVTISHLQGYLVAIEISYGYDF
jgi:hypothetical protein